MGTYKWGTVVEYCGTWVPGVHGVQGILAPEQVFFFLPFRIVNCFILNDTFGGSKAM